MAEDDGRLRRLRRLELSIHPVRRRCAQWPRLLDASIRERQAAKIRAFFVDPDNARRGIGSLLLERCEQEARAHGFSRVELMATLPGVKLYAARGYVGS